MIDLRRGDCLEIMDDLIAEGVRVDAIITDPPYNIKKAEWDKWKNKNDYTEWLVSVFSKARKFLKENGSFYFFHNDFLQIVNIQNEISRKTDFIFKQLIVWNKRYDGVYNKGFLDGFCETNQLRNYQKMAEYCLYYTLQDETGLSTVKLDINNFSSLRKYFRDIQEQLSVTKKEIVLNVGQKADHCFRWGSSQWDIARTYFYMMRTYPKRIKISEEKLKMFRKWDRLDPESEEEKKRKLIIKGVL